MFFLNLKKGRISLKPDEGRERSFGRTAYKAIGLYLAQWPGWSFITSSSVNHPQEYGFPRSFNVDRVMAKAVDVAYRKLAIRVEPGPLELATEAIQEAAKRYPHPGRLPLLFVRSGKNKKDVLITFLKEELDTFLMGVRYSANLNKLTARRKCRA